MTGLELHNGYRALAKTRREYLVALKKLSDATFHARLAAQNLGEACRAMTNASDDTRKASRALLAAMNPIGTEGSPGSELIQMENRAFILKWDFAQFEELASGLGAPKEPARRKR